MAIEEARLVEKFDHLFQTIQTDSFLKMQALGGEIPFFITTFPPRQQIDVNRHLQFLVNKLKTRGISVLEINLFDICLDILHSRDLLQRILDVEPTFPKERFLKMIQAPLDIEHNVIPLIAKRLNEFGGQVVFLTGIGLVFPFIRSHTVLNNLQAAVKKIPIVLFFPGNYNGQALTLFSRFKDDNYYRAFIIDNLEI